MLSQTHGLVPEPNRDGAGQSPLRAPLLEPSPDRLLNCFGSLVTTAGITDGCLVCVSA